jgi:hypothetical protein
VGVDVDEARQHGETAKVDDYVIGLCLNLAAWSDGLDGLTYHDHSLVIEQRAGFDIQQVAGANKSAGGRGLGGWLRRQRNECAQGQQ